MKANTDAKIQALCVLLAEKKIGKDLRFDGTDFGAVAQILVRNPDDLRGEINSLVSRKCPSLEKGLVPRIVGSIVGDIQGTIFFSFHFLTSLLQHASFKRHFIELRRLSNF